MRPNHQICSKLPIKLGKSAQNDQFSAPKWAKHWKMTNISGNHQNWPTRLEGEHQNWSNWYFWARMLFQSNANLNMWRSSFVILFWAPNDSLLFSLLFLSHFCVSFDRCLETTKLLQSSSYFIYLFIYLFIHLFVCWLVCVFYGRLLWPWFEIGYFRWLFWNWMIFGPFARNLSIVLAVFFWCFFLTKFGGFGVFNWSCRVKFEDFIRNWVVLVN